MEEKVAVGDAVHGAVREYDGDVALESLADAEGAADAVNEFALAIGEFVGMRGIDSGEMGVAKRILLAFKTYGALLEVACGEEITVLHSPLRMALVKLALEFEGDDGNGFVHACVE